jgi:hypothetical protein
MQWLSIVWSSTAPSTAVLQWHLCLAVSDTAVRATPSAADSLRLCCAASVTAPPAGTSPRPRAPSPCTSVEKVRRCKRPALPSKRCTRGRSLASTLSTSVRHTGFAAAWPADVCLQSTHALLTVWVALCRRQRSRVRAGQLRCVRERGHVRGHSNARRYLLVEHGHQHLRPHHGLHRRRYVHVRGAKRRQHVSAAHLSSVRSFGG